MYLMNGEKPVMWFSFEDEQIEVIDNDFLPISLKDFVKTSDFSSKETMKKSFADLSAVKDFFLSRLLSFSKTESKAILHSQSFHQSNKVDDRIKIVLACQSLSMIDNFWTKPDDSGQMFKDVNLRSKHLRDAAYPISILQMPISATREEIQPDISALGMFPKTWYREPGHICLWKTDNTRGNINVTAECRASEILDKTNIEHVRYSQFERDGHLFSRCECIATDELSIVDGYAVKDWCDHTGRNFLAYLEALNIEKFSQMCVSDYFLANTDRHLGNIHFFIDNKTNTVLDFTPLLDFNQALIADEFGVSVDDQIYDVTGRPMLETAVKYYGTSNIEFSSLPGKCEERLDMVISQYEKSLESFDLDDSM